MAITAGTTIMALSAIITTLGTFLADFNETHVKNPRWPPHARFHNGQTMSLSIVTALLVLYFIYRPTPSNPAKTDSLFTAALIGSIYCGTGLSGILYPGAEGVDPEFGTGFPTKWLFSGLVGMNWAGWGLERGYLRGGLSRAVAFGVPAALIAMFVVDVRDMGPPRLVVHKEL